MQKVDSGKKKKWTVTTLVSEVREMEAQPSWGWELTRLPAWGRAFKSLRFSIENLE